MEKITLEQIDLVMERANVSFADAKLALEQSNGDIVNALLYLEKENKMKKTAEIPDSKKLRNLWAKLSKPYFVMKKDDRTFLNIPCSIALICTVLCMPFSVLGLIIGVFFFNIKINIIGEGDTISSINDSLNKFQK